MTMNKPKQSATSPNTGNITSSADKIAEIENAQSIRFEEALNELSSIVQSIETNRLPLEDMLQQYRRGVLLARIAQMHLERVDAQIQILDNSILQPLIITDTDGEFRPPAHSQSN